MNRRERRRLEKMRRKAGGHSPETAALLDQAGRHRQAGRLGEAAAAYEQALAAKPDDAEVLSALGAVLIDLGRPEDATARLRQAIAARPEYAEAHFNLGLIAEGRGRLDDARGHYEKALAINPKWADALNNLGNVCKRQGDADEAVACYRKALKAEPRQAMLHFNIGVTLLESGRADEAVAAFRKVLAIEPRHDEALSSLGAALIGQGKLEEAVAALGRAVDINPRHFKALNNLATASIMVGRLEEAAAYLRQALAANPRHVDSLNTFGAVLTKQGRIEEALEAFRRVVALNPGNATAAHMIAAISGDTTATAPRDYVRKLFDTFAWRFDDDLVNKLGYRVPALMRQAVENVAGGTGKFARALDLGCGTGLVAEAFKDMVGAFHGVDLSPRMADEARRKGLYRDIVVGDLCEVLERPDMATADYDLVVAGDTFIYVGELTRAFAAIGRVVTDAGLFVFSVERLEEGDYKLMPSGRYAQSDAYINRLAADNGFRVITWEPVEMRREQEALPVAGAMYILRRGD